MEVIKCNTKVAMETIGEARNLNTRDVFKVPKLHSPAARAILRTLKTSLVPIYHEMHERLYDFLYIFPRFNESKERNLVLIA